MKVIPLFLVGATCVLFAFHATAAPQPKNQSEWIPSLSAEESPAKKPWEDGATLALNSIDGKSTVVADAVLKLERVSDALTSNGFSRQVWGPGIYLHRSTDSVNPMNDRGLNFSYGGLWIDNGPADGGRRSWGWLVNARFGKKLTSEMVESQRVWFDKNSARLTAGGQYIYAPSAGFLNPGNIERKLYHFYSAAGRLYVDQASGGSGVSGCVSGAEVSIRADAAPQGIVPFPVAGTGLAVVPTIGIWAQYQNDMSASGGRVRDNRVLYGVKLQFLFSQLDSDGMVPGISFERTMGSDILTGRANSGITKLVLSLKY